VSIRFSADEIFEIAGQIERNGAEFYRRAAEKFTEPAVRDTLLMLASMEDRHERTFAAMRAELPAGDRPVFTFDPDDQAALYLKTVAEEKVFDLGNEPASVLSGSAAPEDILDFAIGIEKESVVFYTGMKKVVPEGLGREKIDGIIGEEIGHINDLRARKAGLRKR